MLLGRGRLQAGLALVAVAGVAACAGASQAGAPAPPSVVVTTNILGDVATETLGEHADVTTLMPVGADPHSFDISAAEAQEVNDADLIIANGLGLEENIASVVEAAADDGVPLREVGPELDPLTYGDEAGGDEGRADPHVWTDPSRMAAVPGLIADWVAEETELDRDAVAADAEAYARAITEADEAAEERLAGLPDERRKLITNHHVFGYFAERYDFEVVGAVLPSGTTLASPSAADLEDLATTITDSGVPALFADSSAPDRLVEVLASEVDLDVEVVTLFTESLGPEGSGAETYLDMVGTNTEAIADALGG